MQDYPFVRQLAPPLTRDQLRPLDPRCRAVQFSEPLSDAELVEVAKLLQGYRDVTLRVYGHYQRGCDLELLRHFPFLRRFQVDVFDLGDFRGLRHLPDNLEYLGLGRTRSRTVSLAVLGRFQDLRELYIESHKKDIDVIARLSSLQDLTLRSITLPDLALLKSLNELRSLDIKLGGTRDLGLLPEIGHLRYLEIWMVKGLSDLSPIGGMRDLQYLFLQAIKNVQNIPSLKSLALLRRVHIETMKGITDLSGIAQAPRLEELLVVDMPHLQPEALRPFVDHPTLKRASVGLGSLRKNRDVKELLGLPAVEGGFQFRS